VLWAVGECGSAADQSWQERVNFVGEVVIPVTNFDVVEDVIKDVEDMQSLPPS
jgi:hypothetical protein